MSGITTVLFDFDGTLGDTNHLITTSYLHVLDNHYPGQYTAEMVRPFNGPSLEEVFSGIDQVKGPQMVQEYRRFNREMHDQLIAPFPDVASSLAKLKKSGLKLAVVSTKYNKTLRRGLDSLNLTPYFDVIIGGDDYQKVKPDPEPLLLAMERLDVTASECVMVGDNWQDIQAGHNAKVASIFVSWSQKTVAEMLPYGPDKIVDSMVELTEWLLKESEK